MNKETMKCPRPEKPELNTAASVISYVSKIEQESATLYEEWAERYETVRDLFRSIAKENRRHESNIKRAYYSVVSDALETGFSFKGLSADVHFPKLEEGLLLIKVLEEGIALENNMLAFYTKASETSRSLLADVSRAMMKAAKSRSTRIERLSNLLRSESGNPDHQ